MLLNYALFLLLGINILQMLKAENKKPSSLTDMTSSPLSSIAGVYEKNLTERGLVLTPNAVIEFPVESNFRHSLGKTIRNKSRLCFGVQLLPKKLIVHIGGRKSVFFDYNVHGGRWHSFAIGIGDQSVSLSFHCGKKFFTKKVAFEIQDLGTGTVFTLGRMDPHSAQFEGVICQLEMIPSAEASANYCQYVKRQCRHADTYRSTDQSTEWDYTPFNGNRNVENEIQAAVKRNSTSATPSREYTDSSSDVALFLQHVNQFHGTVVSKNITLLESGAKNLLDSKGSSRNSSTDDLTQTEMLLPQTTMNKNDSQTKSEVWRILNRTLYRSSNGMPVREDLSPMNQVSYDDYHYNVENSYDIYDYDYEEINAMFEMEQLRGDKGEPGPPVSFAWFYSPFFNNVWESGNYPTRHGGSYYASSKPT
uniref:Laminin G domain-containing protein n=1 Tax=Leptobrachium leishanense TaxID=445787 RepID=A0A8C5PS04_9ANUR